MTARVEKFKGLPARTALMALLGGATAIGFSPIFVRISEVGPTATAFYRVALALPLLAVLNRSHPESGPKQGACPSPTAIHYATLILSGVFFAGDLALWHWSLNHTTVANSTLLANAAPIFVALGGRTLYRETIGRQFLLGLALALGGAGLLVGHSFKFGFGCLFGDALALGAAIFYAAYLLTLRGLRSRFNTATIMMWSSASCAALLLPVALTGSESLRVTTAGGWATLLGLALLSHTGGQGLITFAMAHLPASFAAVTLLLEPVVAAAVAWVLFAEHLTALQILGGGVVLAGIYRCRNAGVDHTS